jgi:hypothetical protein
MLSPKVEEEDHSKAREYSLMEKSIFIIFCLLASSSSSTSFFLLPVLAIAMIVVLKFLYFIHPSFNLCFVLVFVVLNKNVININKDRSCFWMKRKIKKQSQRKRHVSILRRMVKTETKKDKLLCTYLCIK